MFGIVNYPTFVFTVLLFLAIPGPGLLGIVAATGKHGRRAGFASTLGVVAGDWVHMTLAGIGVAALLQANPLVFKAIQYLGAAYLIYIGVTLLRVKALESNSSSGLEANGGTQDFRRLFLITLMNPKAIVFYMAFFPLFINPAEHHGAWTLLAMGVTVSCLTVLFCFSVVLLVNLITTRLKKNAWIGRVAHKVAGVTLIGFGIKLSTN
ncbi:LysE family translocator [Undibacterium sp. Jales W-56]|uniref:LysE family translocator n=1 Tax=Undibacterium sp. Jales W-56 TaxID=2897325 RepID=UPI0021CFB4E1|nr:LysE family translocator [Undibacterium sp. Jales W-56]MCU6432558.1 LysE family translocator [Undibacterium sp. Jales W-56]